MPTNSYPCYACGASVLEGMGACKACGSEMTEKAYNVFLARQAGEQLAERWKNATFMFSVLALGVGLALGMWMNEAPDPPSNPAHDRATPTTSTAQLSRAQFNDLFMRMIEEDVHLGLSSWTTAPQRGLILEMRPPGARRQWPLWERLNHQQRRNMMGVIGVAYTRALLAADQPVDLEEGHPVVTLQYQGIDQPLAIRRADGNLQLFPSPFVRQGEGGSAPSGGDGITR